MPETASVRPRLLALALAFAGGLVVIGLWRCLAVEGGARGVGSGPTLAFVGWTVFFVFVLRRRTDLGRLGFETRPTASHLGLALLGVGLLQAWDRFGSPLLALTLGSERDLGRFEGEIESLAGLLALLVFSWLFAAAGEELAFRVVLLRGLAAGLGGTPRARLVALAGQAVTFATVHLYQGQAGVVETGLSGLVYGALVLLARGSIWPALLAHGIGNSIGLVTLYLRSAPV